jgi:hypothetical protein
MLVEYVDVLLAHAAALEPGPAQREATLTARRLVDELSASEIREFRLPLRSGMARVLTDRRFLTLHADGVGDPWPCGEWWTT